MSYYIDLTAISIEEYKGILRDADFIPSWRVLKNDIEANLDAIEAQGIRNLDELQKALKSKAKLQDLARQSGLSEAYLNVLRRAVNGYLPKPNRIIDFPGVPGDVAEKLKTLGIRNTLHLYEHILTPEARTALSQRAGISADELARLARLTDLSRIRWVNHTFAYVLLEAGYESVEQVAKADHQEMYERIRQLNKERSIYKGNIGAHDMKLCIDSAQGLDVELRI